MGLGTAVFLFLSSWAARWGQPCVTPNRSMASGKTSMARTAPKPWCRNPAPQRSKLTRPSTTVAPKYFLLIRSGLQNTLQSLPSDSRRAHNLKQTKKPGSPTMPAPGSKPSSCSWSRRVRTRSKRLRQATRSCAGLRLPDVMTGTRANWELESALLLRTSKEPSWPRLKSIGREPCPCTAGLASQRGSMECLP